MHHDMELAKRFDDEVIERYGHYFQKLLAAALKQSVARMSATDSPEEAGDDTKPEAENPLLRGDPQNAHAREDIQILDLECGTGAFCLEAFAAAPKDARLVALSDDRFALKAMHEKLATQDRERIFPRKENVRRLGFADEQFSHVLLCLPTRPLKKVRTLLRVGLKMLRPGGELVLCLPLRGSFHTLLSSLDNSDASDSYRPELQRVLAERVELKSLAEWQKELQNLGAAAVVADEESVEVATEGPLAEDPLFAEHLLPMWLGRYPGRESDALLKDAKSVDRPVKVKIGILRAQRGPSAIDESTIS